MADPSARALHDAAIFCLGMAAAIHESADGPEIPSAFPLELDAIKDLESVYWDYREAPLSAVSHRLNGLHQAPVQYGSFVRPNAHLICFDFARSVLDAVWAAADPKGFNRAGQTGFDSSTRIDFGRFAKRWPIVAKALRALDLPDHRLIASAVEQEAARAMANTASLEANCGRAAPSPANVDFLNFSSNAEFCAANLWWVIRAAEKDDPSGCQEMLLALQNHSEQARRALPQFQNELAIVADGTVDCFGNGEFVFPSAHEAAINLERALRLSVLMATDGPGHLRACWQEGTDGKIDLAPIHEQFVWPTARKSIVEFPKFPFGTINAAIQRERAKMLHRILASASDSTPGDFISCLLAGPDDVELAPREMALLEAHLRQPVSFATIQQEKKETGHSPTEAARNKLKLIRDFNRGLQGQGNADEAGKKSAPAPAVAPKPAPKRSTERGEGRAKLIAALTKHHKYADGGCLNPKPIGNNELARLAGVAKRTASAFFDKEFRGHGKYKALCTDTGRLAAALKLLNGEYAPHLLYGSNPPEKSERNEDADDE